MFSSLLSLLYGCRTNWKQSADAIDWDGDWYAGENDCDEAKAEVNSGAVETWYDGVDQNCDGANDYDQDGDGYVAVGYDEFKGLLEGGDCRDEEASIHPDAVETDGDEIDSDCDDCLDNYVTRYEDRDSDGHGDPDLGVSICPEDSEGYVESADDCDDDNPDIYPGADEHCNETDDDCDEEIDEEAVDQETWYVDWDEDGFGDEATEFLSCEEWGEGYSQTAGDCDDSNPDFYPDAPTECLDQDANCDGISDAEDGDGDGYLGCEECDDTNETIFPGADELCNGVDDDCDEAIPSDETDDDGDGYNECADDDCDDSDGTSNPGGTETAYDGIDQDCSGADLTDVDGDGYASTAVTGGTDCDDSDSAINPGAVETAYDGTDQDCTGADLTDVDEDGYDSTAVAGGTDCDDNNASISPAASEICDSSDTDEDCDGYADDDDPEGATGKVTRYADADGDGYGDPDTEDQYCDPDSSLVSDNTDCDDGEATAYLGNTETCNDGIDNDCDGTSNSCELSGEYAISRADTELIGEAAGDYAGYAVSIKGDVDGDGLNDILAGAYGDDDGGTDAGAAYLIQGPVSGTASLSSATAKLTGESAGDLAGIALASVGDTNSDGYDDFLVGASAEDAGGTDAGAAYLIRGPVSGTASLSSATAKLTGEADDDGAGEAVASAGDTNGDGYDDLLVGAPFEDSGGTDAGAAYLFQGPVSSTASLATAAAILIGESGSNYAGVSVASAGDVDGDGLDDILTGAYYAPDGSGAATGAAYLLLSPVSGIVDLSTAYSIWTGEATNDIAGFPVAPGGDLDGDGYPDILTGAYGEDSGGSTAGAAYVMTGPFSGGTTSLSTSAMKFVGEADDHNAGLRLSPVGDFDGDSYDDLAISASWNNDVGAVYLLYGRLSPGTFDLSTADAKLTGEASDDRAGIGLSGGGDTDGDGFDDLLVGSFQADSNGTDAGSIHLILGQGL